MNPRPISNSWFIVVRSFLASFVNILTQSHSNNINKIFIASRSEPIFDDIKKITKNKVTETKNDKSKIKKTIKQIELAIIDQLTKQ